MVSRVRHDISMFSNVTANCKLFVYIRCGALMSRVFQQRPLQRVLVFQPGLCDHLKCDTVYMSC